MSVLNVWLEQGGEAHILQVNKRHIEEQDGKGAGPAPPRLRHDLTGQVRWLLLRSLHRGALLATLQGHSTITCLQESRFTIIFGKSSLVTGPHLLFCSISKCKIQQLTAKSLRSVSLCGCRSVASAATDGDHWPPTAGQATACQPTLVQQPLK